MAETKTTKTTSKATTSTKTTTTKAAAPKATATKTTATKTATATKAAAPKATTTKTTVAKAPATKTVATKPAVKAEKKTVKPVVNGKIRVTMVHGLASCTQRQIRTAKALKLSRPGDTRELPNLPSTLGACKKLEHLVKVEII